MLGLSLIHHGKGEKNNNRKKTVVSSNSSQTWASSDGLEARTNPIYVKSETKTNQDTLRNQSEMLLG